MSCSARDLTRRRVVNTPSRWFSLTTFTSKQRLSASWRDVEWPAVDDAVEVAFTVEVGEQLAHLLGASGVHHVTPVELGELTDGSVFDRADTVAAATQFFGEVCADAGVVGEDEPGRVPGCVLASVRAHLSFIPSDVTHH